MNIAVLGANGFIGKNVLNNLGSKYSVFGITRDNYEEFKSRQFDIFINAAGNSKKYWAKDNQLEDFNKNVTEVYKSVQDFKYDKYIYLSSVDAITNNSVYGFHKYLAEKVVINCCNKYLILELGAVIGPGIRKGVLHDLINKEELHISEQSNLYLITTKEISNIIEFLLEKDIVNDYFAVAGITPVSIPKMAQLLGVNFTVQNDSPTVAYNLRYYLERLNNIYPLKTSEEYIKEYLNDTK